MATKKKAVKSASVVDFAILATIVSATNAGSFVYTAAAVHAPMIEAGLAEVNPDIKNEAGEIATRATIKGIETVNSQQTQNAASPAATVAPSAFKLETGVALPAITGRGRIAKVYPFDEMQPGQSFFVANTDKKPNAGKSLASTVSSATNRYAVATGENKTVVVKQYQLDASGKRAKDAAGKLIVIGTTTEVRPVMKEVRKYVVRSVTENGVAGARVWRTA